jgi:hypothetical protein
MKYIQHLFTFILYFFLLISVASQNSFEIIREIPGPDDIYKTIELDDFYYFLGSKTSDSAFTGMANFILKTNKEGSFVDEVSFIKQDTVYSHVTGFVKKNGNFLFFGHLSDSITPMDKNVTYICEMTPDLDVLWEKMFPIPFPPYHSHHILYGYLITPDDHIIIHGTIDTSLYGANKFLYFSKFDMNGNQISFVPHLNFKDLGIGGSSAVFKPDSSGFYMIGNLSYTNVGWVRNWVELDLDMNILAHGLIDNGLPTSGSCSKSRRLSNGNIVFANTNGNPQEIQNMKMWILDQSFNEIYGAVYYTDQSIRLLNWQGMDFYSEDKIWVATFIPIPETFPGEEEFYVYLFDSDVKLEGSNVFGGDKRYWLSHLLATSDGGCIITGVVPEYEGSQYANGYILKLMPNDMLTHTTETPMKYTGEVMVYPNPFSREISISSKSSGLKFSLFNITGNEVIRHELRETSDISLSAGHLQKGFYFFTIRDGNQIIQNGKLIKN